MPANIPAMDSGDTFIKVFQAVAPSIVAILAVFFTYKFGVKLKKHDAREDYYKKVRGTVTNLLLIWKELSGLEKFFKSKDPTDEIIYSVPKIAQKYLGIDKEKITQLKQSYEESLNYLKEFDLVLFFNLQNVLLGFNQFIDEGLIAILEDSTMTLIERGKTATPILEHTLKELQEEIETLAAHLPKKEESGIKKIISEHVQSLGVYKPNEVPKFILTYLNKSLQPASPITADEMNTLINNPTFIWLLKKLFKNKEGAKLFDMIKPAEFLKLLSIVPGPDSKALHQIVGGISEYELFRNIEINEIEEKQYFTDNKAFYKICLGMFLKFGGAVPYQAMRLCAKLNTGKVSVREELEKHKLELLNQELIRASDEYRKNKGKL